MLLFVFVWVFMHSRNQTGPMNKWRGTIFGPKIGCPTEKLLSSQNNLWATGIHYGMITINVPCSCSLCLSKLRPWSQGTFIVAMSLFWAKNDSKNSCSKKKKKCKYHNNCSTHSVIEPVVAFLDALVLLPFLPVVAAGAVAGVLKVATFFWLLAAVLLPAKTLMRDRREYIIMLLIFIYFLNKNWDFFFDWVPFTFTQKYIQKSLLKGTAPLTNFVTVYAFFSKITTHWWQVR